ncbi:MAG: hypothetical protein RRY08_07160 [Christensenella sp.]
MKKWVLILIVIIIIAVILIIGIWSFFEQTAQNAEFAVEGNENAEFAVNAEESFFSEFKVDTNNVYFYCNIAVQNNGSEDVSFTLQATDNEDCKSGLLKDAEMSAIDIKTKELQVFNSKAGVSESYRVVFCGARGEQYPPQKLDRMLPEIITLTVL